MHTEILNFQCPGVTRITISTRISQYVSVTEKMCTSQTVSVCQSQSVSVTDNMCLSQTVFFCERQSMSVTDSPSLSQKVVVSQICLSQTLCVSHK